MDSIERKVFDWYRTKRERGLAGSPHKMFGSSDRWDNQRTKKDIKKWVEGMSGLDGTLRDSVFTQFRAMEIDKIVKREASIRRNRVHAIRLMRLSNGNPRHMYEGPFWSDPSCKYVPEEQVPIAEKHGVKFERLTVKMFAGRATRIVTEAESRRPHKGYWSHTTHDEHDWDYKLPQPVTFLFENAGDMAYFRLAYSEYPIVPEPGPATVAA